MPSLTDVKPVVQAHPLVVAGPCSAESQEQVLAAARALSRAGVNVFRAGVWKPRTLPGGFEGVGEKGLQWLALAKAETGLPIATEVATPLHALAAVDAGVDVLWIGARTATDPFAVQEIADVLAASHRTDVAVMVKNPVSPDPSLWLGALLRLRRAGVRRLAAVHRGFYGESAQYRNVPLWRVPIELKRRCPALQVIVDPSHMGGRREFVPELSQQALDMGFDGLMIEAHPEPEQALSDVAQQITPHDLEQLLAALRVRHPGSADDRDLAVLRSLIDECDDQLLAALSRRMDIARQIGDIKRQRGIAIVQTSRFTDILARRTAQAAGLRLGTDFVAALLQLIHQEAVHQQLPHSDAPKSAPTPPTRRE